ncbi:MAG: PDZ domain-containing protein [Verrucomicrobiota bacterium]
MVGPGGLELKTAVVEATRLRTLVEFRGDSQHPVTWITLRGLTFRHAARTIMDTREPLLRSDWAIYRGGAILFNGAEDCALEESFVDQVGGNAVFVNNYNRRLAIRGTQIAKAGASGICFVGDPQAARSPLFNYSKVQPLAEIDRTPGPKTENYPANCLVDDCLIHQTGRVEKQTAGVEIDLSQGITVRHCSIYDLPRAGINIGDGCWGGHVIEFCDVFDTVKETGDHGSFNSWGRDRYWRPNIDEVNAWVRQVPELPKLDAIKPVVLANNRWRCDHGWDIDLDDGSSFYIITNNLCLHGGIKNREGFGRVVENNIMVEGGYDPHVWFAESGDIFRRNILWTTYRPAIMHRPPWGADMDFNLVHSYGAVSNTPAARLQQQSGRDEHSIIADAQFIDPAQGDYRVKDGSPALALGFVNFRMDQFGVRRRQLRAVARTPQLPQLRVPSAATDVPDAPPAKWFGATIRNIAGPGEMSAFGLPGVGGILVLQVPAGSALAKAGLRKNDVILSVNGDDMPNTAALLRQYPGLDAQRFYKIGVSRDQKRTDVLLNPRSSGL